MYNELLRIYNEQLTLIFRTQRSKSRGSTPEPGYREQGTGYRERVTGYGLRVTGYGRQVIKNDTAQFALSALWM